MDAGPSNKDDRIFDAAMELLTSNGRFSMSELAKEAGIGRATLFRRYGSKQHLLEQLKDRGAPVGPHQGSTRERILAASQDWLREHDLASLSAEKVARHAGVAPVTVYRLFSSRDGLIRETVATLFPTYEAGDVFQPGRRLHDVLLDVARLVLAFTDDYGDLVTALLRPEAAAAGAPEHTAAPQKNIRVLLEDFFQSEMDAGRMPISDPAYLARAILSLLLTEPLIDRSEPQAHIPMDLRAERAVSCFLFGAMGEQF